MSAGVLAVEWSSRRLSLAYAAKGAPVLEKVVEVERFRAGDAMRLAGEALAAIPKGWEAVGEIQVGRGPGNYSGIRQAFAWAAGIAAPGNIRVAAVSSGRAQARRWIDESGGPVWILGDARRGVWWGRRFEEGNDAGEEWTLASPEAWRERTRGARVVSAESTRLAGLENVVEDFPRAADLLSMNADEPARPIYLHPAVG